MQVAAAPEVRGEATGVGRPLAVGWARELAVAVAWPFAVSRAALVLVAWLGAQLAPSWTYFDYAGAARGWSRVPSLALDAWGRYDTFWYLDLAAWGYRPVADHAAHQSHLAFFPLYPWLVRAVHALLPGAWQGDAARYAVAVAVANACALAALAVVFALVREAWGDARLARRAVLYLLLFPGGFFLSCAYSESLYLVLAAAALLLAGRGRLALAALPAFLAGLSRPSGILLAPVLALAAHAGGRLRTPGAALAIAAAPAGLALHGARLALLTGDALALFHVQAAWGRTLAAPWTTLLRPAGFHPVMGPLEAAAVLLVGALAVRLWLARRQTLALFTALALAPVLLSGTLMSATRLVAVAFPAFAALAELGEREGVDRAVVIGFATTQAALFLLWTRFYWVS